MILLKISGLVKSVYYYTLSKTDKDGKNKEIISHNISKSPNLEQVNDMPNKASDDKNLEGLIFHSDQGWQYQHQSYQQRLKNKGIKQSMPRKGNSIME